MLYCGIDFGSTYTVVTVYYPEEDKLEVIPWDQGSPYIPTMAAVMTKDARKWRNGKSAKDVVGKSAWKVYEAFKLLLPEQNPKMLEKRGFSEENSPITITKRFLSDLVDRIRNMHQNEDKIHLVIGTPAIWFEEMSSLGGNGILHKICKEIPGIVNVEVVSEPTAAAAYCIYHYYKEKKQSYAGHILLIDYGGGTLDITLTEVTAGGEGMNRLSMEIRERYRTGAGEVTEGQIGKAGIAYMERVVEEAMKEMLKKAESEFDTNGLDDDDKMINETLRKRLSDENTLVSDTNFQRAVIEFESELLAGKAKIEEKFQWIDPISSARDFISEDDEDEYIFTTISYRVDNEDVMIPVSYVLLAEVYCKTIAPVLEATIKESQNKMTELGIDYSIKGEKTFKLALVGGFGNFYLVKKQIFEMFKISNFQDSRLGIMDKQTDCEQAISLGTAVLSANLVGIKHTAPYSIAIPQFDPHKGEWVYDNYAFELRQDIQPGHVYYQKNSNGDYVLTEFFGKTSIEAFIIKRNEHKPAGKKTLKEQFKEKLSALIGAQIEEKVVCVGFSLDRSNILSVHVREFVPGIGWLHKEDEAPSISLGEWNDLFVPQVAYMEQ